MKKLALLMLVVACEKPAPNLAEIMVSAQVKKATCTRYAAEEPGKPDIALCDVPTKEDEKKTVRYLSIYQKDKVPFQAFAVSDGTPTPAPSVPQPTGSGSGSAKK